MKHRGTSFAKLVLRASALFLISLSLSGCTLDRICAQQDQASQYLPELTGEITYGQTFQASENGLYRIDLSTATFGRENTCPVIFHLKASPDDIEDIRTVVLPGEQIENSHPTSIVFDQIEASTEQAFYFYLDSPEGTAGNAVTVYLNDENQYYKGEALINHQAISGDLVFTAYCQQQFTFKTVASDFIARIKQDITFAICYGVVIFLLIIAVLRYRKKTE